MYESEEEGDEIFLKKKKNGMNANSLYHNL